MFGKRKKTESLEKRVQRIEKARKSEKKWGTIKKVGKVTLGVGTLATTGDPSTLIDGLFG